MKPGKAWILLLAMGVLRPAPAQAFSFQPRPVYYLCDSALPTPVCPQDGVPAGRPDSVRADSSDARRGVSPRAQGLDEPIALPELKRRLSARSAGKIWLVTVWGEKDSGAKASFQGDSLRLGERAFRLQDVGNIRWLEFNAERLKFAGGMLVFVSAFSAFTLVDLPLMLAAPGYGFPYAATGFGTAAAAWTGAQALRRNPKDVRAVYFYPRDYSVPRPPR